jgi:hypothetical protein
METDEGKKLREMLMMVRKMALHGIGEGGSEVDFAECAEWRKQLIKLYNRRTLKA